MKVAGKFIRRRRLNYGLSQHQLAEGVCAQATVSLIENQNNCPNLNILTQISRRLNVSVKSMLKRSLDYTDVGRAILDERYQQAKAILFRIPRHQFKTYQQMDRYFCYRGVLAIVDLDYHNALYFFNKVMSMDSNVVNRYYRAWSNIGLSYVYFKLKDSAKSLEFAKYAQNSLNINVNYNLNLSILVFVRLRITLAKLLAWLGQYTQSNSVCFKTIKDLVKGHLMYGLEDVYNQINQNYVRLKRRDHARLALSRAKLFHRMYKNPVSLL